ncbi:MAG: D-alanine--D-alanine ligase family protein, partial [Kiritimatiellia bacterium]
MTEPVLILFNEPQSLEQTSPGRPYESDAGVLKEVEAVAAALKSLGVEHRRGCVSTLREVERLFSACPEKVVVNLVERLGPSVFDACLVPAVCEAVGKVYTGNGAVAQILALDKWLTKAVLQAHGVSVPRACVIPPEAQIFDPGWGAKALIVKPLRSDASEGIDASSVVSVGNFRGLERAVLRVHRQFEQPALVEEYIEGREINVSLLEKDGKLLVLPLAEIDFSAFPPGKPRIVDYAAKWLENSFEYDNTPRKIPAALEENTATRVRACARAAWHGLGCRDYARVDIRLDEQGQPYV